MADPTVQLVAEAAEPLPDIDEPGFAEPFDRFGYARVVLLGEASHGTSEFYRARAAITRRLIERHGFTIVAIEGDWPDAATVNRFVRGQAPDGSGTPFARFPTWMWRNVDFTDFLHWLRDWNQGREDGAQTGFYGLDLYNMSGSIRAVLDYLDENDPDAAVIARRRYACLRPWMEEPQHYGLMAASSGYALCEDAVVQMLKDLHARQMDCQGDCEGLLDATGNARLVANAEMYYRAMYEGAAESWNVRDTHMFETLTALFRAHPDAKAVVWAHNSHIGDASKTEMGMRRGELNIGQLVRERFGRAAALIGFGTDHGTVTCADDWDAPTKTKQVRPSRPDSYEQIAHQTGIGRFLLDLRPGVHEEVRGALASPKLERFIGVIYRPETERWSHYSECHLPDQFDAYVWFEETSAVTPIATEQQEGPDETFPFGL